MGNIPLSKLAQSMPLNYPKGPRLSKLTKDGMRRSELQFKWHLFLLLSQLAGETQSGTLETWAKFYLECPLNKNKQFWCSKSSSLETLTDQGIINNGFHCSLLSNYCWLLIKHFISGNEYLFLKCSGKKVEWKWYCSVFPGCTTSLWILVVWADVLMHSCVNMSLERYTLCSCPLR